LDTEFPARYASLNDEELLQIAGDRRDLLEEAAVARDAETARRGLTQKQARTKKRDGLRQEIKEARAHHPKRNKSKYFEAQINLRAYFLGLGGLVLLMFFTLSHHRVPDEWSMSLFVLYLGTLIACLAVQPWVRRTLSFWLSLAISCVPQFVISHWLNAYHPAHSLGETKGSGFLSLLRDTFWEAECLYGCRYSSRWKGPKLHNNRLMRNAVRRWLLTTELWPR
jgi:hypothetical protein